MRNKNLDAAAVVCWLQQGISSDKARAELDDEELRLAGEQDIPMSPPDAASLRKIGFQLRAQWIVGSPTWDQLFCALVAAHQAPPINGPIDKSRTILTGAKAEELLENADELGQQLHRDATWLLVTLRPYQKRTLADEGATSWAVCISDEEISLYQNNQCHRWNPLEAPTQFESVMARRHGAEPVPEATIHIITGMYSRMMAWADWVMHTQVASDLWLVRGTSMAAGGTTVQGFSQASGWVYRQLSADETTTGGVCDALSYLWLMERTGQKTFGQGLLGSLNLKDEELMRTVCAIQAYAVSAGWKIREGAEVLLQDKAVSSDRAIVEVVTGADRRTQGTKVYYGVIELTLRMVRGGHTVAFLRDGDKVDFFDANYGHFQVPTSGFNFWFRAFMAASAYDLAFRSTKMTVVTEI